MRSVIALGPGFGTRWVQVTVVNGHDERMTGPSTTHPDAGDGFVHEALIYRGRDELAEAVRQFAHEARHAHEPILAALPAAHLEWVSDALAPADGVRLEAMEELGGNPARLLPVYREWVQEHDGHARIVSETIWPERSYAETAECLRHEALMNVAFAGMPAAALCPFDGEALDDEVLGDVAVTHPFLRDGAGRRRSERFEDPERVARGERWPQRSPSPPVHELGGSGTLGSLREAVSADSYLEALTPQRREDVVLAVNEAATNALKHGHTDWRLRIWNEGDTVVSEVSSASALDDPLAGRNRPGPEALSGRGLWLINQLCDLVELRSGERCTSVRMHVRAGT